MGRAVGGGNAGAAVGLSLDVDCGAEAALACGKGTHLMTDET